MNILRKSLLLFCISLSCSSSLFFSGGQVSFEAISRGMRDLIFVPVLDYEFLDKQKFLEAGLLKHNLECLYDNIKAEKEDSKILSDLLYWQKVANVKFEILFAKKAVSKVSRPNLKFFVFSEIYKQLISKKIVDNNFINGLIKSFTSIDFKLKKLISINLYDLEPDFCEEYCNFMQDYRLGLGNLSGISSLLEKAVECKNNLNSLADILDLFIGQLDRIKRNFEFDRDILDIYKKADKVKREVLVAHVALIKSREFRKFAQDANFLKYVTLYNKLVWGFLRSNNGNSYAYNKASNIDIAYELKLGRAISTFTGLYEERELMPIGWVQFLRRKYICKSQSEKDVQSLSFLLLRMTNILNTINGKDTKSEQGILKKIVNGNVSEALLSLGEKIL